MSDKLLKRYVKDRDKALRNLDIKEFIDFLYKYVEVLGYEFVRAFVMKDEMTQMATMCKSVCNISSFQGTETYQRARAWLMVHGMKEDIQL